MPNKFKEKPALHNKYNIEAPIIERSDEINSIRLNLPAVEMEYEVVEAVKANYVVIIWGDTGCRENTQIPQVNLFYYHFFYIYLCNTEINDRA